MMVLCDAYCEEEVGENDTRTVLKMHPELAPIKAGIFPLVKKPELLDMATKIKDELSEDFKVLFDEKGSIGKRYRRQDEAGTPFCITVDFDGLEDGTVTLRHRDTMEQERVKASELSTILRKSMKSWSRQ